MERVENRIINEKTILILTEKKGKLITKKVESRISKDKTI